jgi:hypothetical protein
MLLKELSSSITTVGTCVFVVYLAVGVLQGYSSEAEVKGPRIALSSNAAHYIYLRR